MVMADNDNKSIAKHIINVYDTLSTMVFVHYDLIPYEVGMIIFSLHFTDEETKAQNG